MFRTRLSGIALWANLLFVVSLSISVYALSTFRIVRVSGVSMEPTLKDGSFVIVTDAKWIVGEPDRGDIVLADVEAFGTGTMIKRVAAVEGDCTTTLENALSKKHGSTPKKVKEMYTIRKGEYFLTGDNVARSQDSRSFGAVSRDEIQGECLPLDSFAGAFPLSIPGGCIVLMLGSLLVCRRFSGV